MNIEATVTSLDCNHGVCPQTQGAVNCTITGGQAAWYSPPSDSTAIATVSSGEVVNSNIEFTAALVSVNNPGITTNLSFIATTDKNGTQVRCADLIDTNSMTCTIIISGMSLTVSYITNMYYHNKVLQVMFLQHWVLQLLQTFQSLSTGHILFFILTEHCKSITYKINYISFVLITPVNVPSLFSTTVSDTSIISKCGTFVITYLMMNIETLVPLMSLLQSATKTSTISLNSTGMSLEIIII